MYDIAETVAATDAWAKGIARHAERLGMADVPDSLLRVDDFAEPWLRPNLFLSQTCGFPLTHALKGKVRLVAVPDYDVPGCADGRYCSFFIVRQDDPAKSLMDLKGRRAAGNADHSQSGFNVLRHAVAPLSQNGRFFDGTPIWSGSHSNSVGLVASGKADVAAIDAVTFALLQRYQPSRVAGLRVLARSAHAPCLPYITHLDASDEEVALLAKVLFAAAADPDLAEVREALFIKGFKRLPLEAYDSILSMEEGAIRRGYPSIN